MYPQKGIIVHKQQVCYIVFAKTVSCLLNFFNDKSEGVILLNQVMSRFNICAFSSLQSAN